MLLKKTKYLILSYCPVRNRQGFDLNNALLANEVQSWLIQLEALTDPMLHVTGISKPQSSWLWKWRIASKVIRLKMLCSALFFRHRVTIAINMPAILPAIVLKLIFHTKLVFYTLEFGHIDVLHKFLLRHFCDAVIDVEETRLQLILNTIDKKLPSMVMHNMPRRINTDKLAPRLREWLKLNSCVREGAFLAIYAGSYQKYCNLERLIEWAQDFPKGVYLILIMTEVPDHLREIAGESTVFVPSLRHEELYNWLVDGDVALLPYEDNSDNVRYCSPQKLFDSLACGVPFLGSRRPLIQKIADKYKCGITIDFNNKKEFLDSICWFIEQPLAVMRERAKQAHCHENYDSMMPQMISFLEKIGR